MDSRRPPEYLLTVQADRSNVKDIVKGLLHTIFFHRVFTALTPSTFEILDTTLPFVSSPADIEAGIETKCTALLRALETTPLSPQYHNASPKATLTVQFLERKRRKAGWFISKPDEETVWETWMLDVTLLPPGRGKFEVERLRSAMERGLQEGVLRVLGVVNEDRAGIPPITGEEGGRNPFPWVIGVKVGR